MALPLEQTIHKHFLEKDMFFKTKTDSRLKWIPFATVFLLKTLGVNTRSSWKKQVLITATTEAIRYLISDNLKKMTNEHRPFPYLKHDSFPSGHTCSSFAGAEFMRQELKDTHRGLSYVGYAGAVTVATIRLMKSKHWLKDVLAGAVIGVCAAKLAYVAVNRIESRLALRKQSSQDMAYADTVADSSPIEPVAGHIRNTLRRAKDKEIKH